MSYHLAEVDRLSRLYVSLKDLQTMVRGQLDPAIIAALEVGCTPTEVVGVSPYSDAWIRKMAREAGLPPAKPGLKRRV